MNITAVQSWWSQAFRKTLRPLTSSFSPSDGEKVPEGRERGSTNPVPKSLIKTILAHQHHGAASGARPAAVEPQFWTDFARQPGESPSAKAPKPAPTVKPLGILVPTDFSPSSLPAVDCALAIARQHSARLILLHAIHLNVTPFGPAHAGRLKTALCREALAQAEPILVAARKLGVTAVCLVPEGPPAKMIAQIAGQCSTDLVIMTHSQHGMLARLFGGRTVEKVVRTVRCPVLVLPAVGSFL